MMNQDKQTEERAAFEALAARLFPYSLLISDEEGGYNNQDIHIAWEAWQARAALSSRPVQGGDVNIDALIDPDFAGPAEIFEPDTPVVCRSEVYAAIKKLMAPDSFTGFTKEQASAWISHQAREIERLRAEVTSQSRRIHNQRGEINRLSSAPAQPAREPMWRPIETAPKDFVTEFDGWNGERVPSVSWARPEGAAKGEYDWCVSEHIAGHGYVNARVRGLTHWMPLPAAPGITKE